MNIWGDVGRWIKARSEVISAGITDSYGAFPGAQQIGEEISPVYFLQLERMCQQMLDAERSDSIMKLSSANEMVQKNLFLERVPPAEQFCKEELEYGKTDAGILHSVANSHVI